MLLIGYDREDVGARLFDSDGLVFWSDEVS